LPSSNSLTSSLYGVTLVHAPFALTIAVAVPSSLLLSGIVVALLRTTREGRFGRGAVRAIVSRHPRNRRGDVVCALTGYLPLARFLAQQLIVTGSILALVYLLLLWVDGFVQGLGDARPCLPIPRTGWLNRRRSTSSRRRSRRTCDTVRRCRVPPVSFPTTLGNHDLNITCCHGARHAVDDMFAARGPRYRPRDAMLAHIGAARGCWAAAIALAWTIRSGKVVGIPESGAVAHLRKGPSRSRDTDIAGPSNP
jgi:hypothetical protein